MDRNEEAPLDSGSLAGSDTGLIRTRSGGSSNKHAFKVAGLTTLACLLLASQAFTAYMVFGQKQQIHALQENNEQMSKQIVRSSRVVPMKMQMPMETLPLLRNYSPDKDMKITQTPMLKLQDTVVSVEKQVQDLIQDSRLPHFNETFLANLQGLKRQMNETEWQSLETWMRFWLIFQMAQQKPAAIPAPQTKTKCQTEAEPGASSKIGSYKPQCDDQGRYLPTQCWHPTGYCWCVDQDGTVIEGTTVRGRPGCERAPLNMMRLPSLMQKLSSVMDKSGE